MGLNIKHNYFKFGAIHEILCSYFSLHSPLFYLLMDTFTNWSQNQNRNPAEVRKNYKIENVFILYF